MKSFRVYVIWANPLFLELVRRLLDHPRIQVIGASANREEGRRAIESESPDVVIIENGSMNGETLPILQSGASIIQMNLENNQLNVYHYAQRTLRQADELFRLILEESPGNG